jgi:hypothetical protein
MSFFRFSFFMFVIMIRRSFDRFASDSESDVIVKI